MIGQAILVVLGWPQTTHHVPIQMGTSGEQPEATPGLLQITK